MEDTYISLYIGICKGSSMYAHIRVQPKPTHGKCRYAYVNTSHTKVEFLKKTIDVLKCCIRSMYTY